MRLFGRALVLGILVIVCAPVRAAAETVSLPTDPCSLLGEFQTLCTSYNDLASSSGGTVTGNLESADSLALFAFSFSAETLFTVTTSSFATGGFDPTLALFDRNGQILLISAGDPEDPSAQTAARFFDISLESGLYDDHIELTLAADSYYLALINGSSYTFNGVNGSESLALGYGGCLECGFGTDLDGKPLTSTFSFEFSSGVDGGPAPVPEPGTLTLLAGGALVGLFQRRRTKRRGQSE